MSRQSPFQFGSRDPWLALGAVLAPVSLFAFCLAEKTILESGQLAAFSLARAWEAILLSAAAVVVALGAAIFGAGMIPWKGFPRFFPGFALGLLSSGAAVAYFLLHS